MSKSSFPAASRAMHRYMVDTVRVHRPTDIDDATVDANTWEIVAAEPEVLYEGPGLVSPMGDPGDQLIGMGPRSVLYYTVALPLVDTEFQPDDVLTVLLATSDSQMQDATFTIEGQIPSTLAVYKRLRARLDVEAA